MSRQENLNRIMTDIESLGVGTPEYHDAVAFLLTIMAKRQWIIAESIRNSQRDSQRRREAAARRKTVRTT
jgi:hypothetical protein